jgi:hypothetical protein
MQSNNLEFVRPALLNNARILSWFSLKNPAYRAKEANIPGLNIGLNSGDTQQAVLENIHQLCSSIGEKHKNLALANQIHSNQVLEVKEGGVYPNVDGFVTKTRDVILGIQVADCGAILMGDFENKVIGAAHAGWRGAISEIVPNTIKKMLALGANTKHIKVYVSACLQSHNFEVGDEVAIKFPEHLVDRTSYLKPHVNLPGLLFDQMLDSGLLSTNIEIDGRCTIDYENLFYSYRREMGKTGRMLALIKLL